MKMKVVRRQTPAPADTCPRCRKVIHASRDEAESTARMWRDRETFKFRLDPIQAYRCKLGHWHTGHRQRHRRKY